MFLKCTHLHTYNYPPTWLQASTYNNNNVLRSFATTNPRIQNTAKLTAVSWVCIELVVVVRKKCNQCEVATCERGSYYYIYLLLSCCVPLDDVRSILLKLIHTRMYVCVHSLWHRLWWILNDSACRRLHTKLVKLAEFRADTYASAFVAMLSRRSQLLGFC